MPPKKDTETEKSGSEKPKTRKPRLAEKPTELKHFTPLRDKRKRKTTVRYTDPSAKESKKKAESVVVRKGKGKKLEDCENVAEQIEKRRKSDDLLKRLYGVLYGRVTKQSPIKDNLLEFSGVVYEDDDKQGREKLETKLEKQTVGDLKDILMFFGQEPSGLKEELVTQLADFLEKPKASSKTFEISRKRTRSSSTKRSRSSSPARKKKKTAKDPNRPKRPMTSYLLYCEAHRKEVKKSHPNEPVTETAKRLASLWNKATKSDKKKYVEKAEKLKEQYAKDIKKYESGLGSKKKSPSKSKSKKGKKDSKGSGSEESGSEDEKKKDKSDDESGAESS